MDSAIAGLQMLDAAPVIHILVATALAANNLAVAVRSLLEVVPYVSPSMTAL